MEAEILQFIQQNPTYAYAAVFGVLLACGLGMPMPEDITLVAGGYTVYLAQAHDLGAPQLGWMIAVGMVGVLSGDIILFSLGRWLGPKATRIWPFRRLLSPERLERTRYFFLRYGGWTAFIARFAAGLRAPTYLLAGSMGMRLRTFLLADASAALISVPLLVWLAYHFGAQIDRVKVWLTNSKYALVVVLVAFGVFLLVKLIRRWRRERASRIAGPDAASDAPRNEVVVAATRSVAPAEKVAMVCAPAAHATSPAVRDRRDPAAG